MAVDAKLFDEPCDEGIFTGMLAITMTGGWNAEQLDEALNPIEPLLEKYDLVGVALITDYTQASMGQAIGETRKLLHLAKRLRKMGCDVYPWLAIAHNPFIHQMQKIAKAMMPQLTLAIEYAPDFESAMDRGQQLAQQRCAELKKLLNEGGGEDEEN